MFELNTKQWTAWENSVITEFIDRTLDGWRSHFPNATRRFGYALQEEKMRADALEIIKTCERKGVQDAVRITALILLTWKATAMGFSSRFIADSHTFVINECCANQFGLRWFEHVLDQAEEALHAVSYTTTTPPASITGPGTDHRGPARYFHG